MTTWRGKGCSRLLDDHPRGNELKTIPRMGWRVRGVRDGESVAEHSYAVALIAMLLADRLDVDDRHGEAPEDRARSRPAGAHARRHPRAGGAAPRRGRQGGGRTQDPRTLFDGHRGAASEYVELWKEFAERSSVEGRLVRAIDKLEMFTQAYQYERAGNRMLDDFWGLGRQHAGLRVRRDPGAVRRTHGTAGTPRRHQTARKRARTGTNDALEQGTDTDTQGRPFRRRDHEPQADAPGRLIRKLTSGVYNYLPLGLARAPQGREHRPGGDGRRGVPGDPHARA